MKRFVAAMVVVADLAQVLVSQEAVVKRGVVDPQQSLETYPVPGSHMLWRQEMQIRQYLKDHPEAIEQARLMKRTAWNFEVGSKGPIQGSSWWATNIATDAEYQVPSTSRAVGSNCYIFVEDTLWNNRVTQAAVDSMLAAWELRTPALSTKGIYQLDVETFGSPPDVDQDPKIIILILDIRDGFTGSGGYVAGYFFSLNEFSDADAQSIGRRSNFAEIYYVDANPLNLTTASDIELGASTTAHEFQHMIHWNYDPNEITFVNESCSMVAELVCGYPYSTSDQNRYTNNIDISLLNWLSSLADYSRAARWALYLWNQFPDGFLKRWVQSTFTGITGMDMALQEQETSRRFADVFVDWLVANYLNDPAVDTLYAYTFAQSLTKAKATIFADPNTGVQNGTANGAITVGSYVSKWEWSTNNLQHVFYSGADRTADISTFSSIGPTRDGRMKPDIAAPGQGVGSALSSFANASATGILPGGKQQVLSGTSMASPHVAGAAALLLGAFPNLNLTAAQVKSLLTSTTRTDVFTSTSVPTVVWGCGKLDVLNAMVKAISSLSSATRTTLAYDRQTANHQNFTLSSTNKFAVRFTPAITGRLTGVFVQLRRYSDFAISGVGSLECEVFTNAFGVPGTTIGSTVSVPFSQLVPGIMNYIDMMPANASVAAGTDFHVVLTVPNSPDALVIAGDDGLGSTNRSSVYTGGRWADFNDLVSGFTFFAASSNLRVRSVVTALSGPVLAQDEGATPLAYELAQNFPNPFNPLTSFEFRLSAGQAGVPGSELVNLRVYDLLGREVAILVHEELKPGSYRIRWNASQLPSGVYFYTLRAGSSSETKKAILLK